jgi:hypothetical protein
MTLHNHPKTSSPRPIPAKGWDRPGLSKASQSVNPAPRGQESHSGLHAVGVFLSVSLFYTGVKRVQACCSSRRARCCSGVFRLEDQTTRDVVVGFSTSLTQWWGRYPNIGKGSLGPSVSQRSRHGFQNPPVPDVRLDIYTLKFSCRLKV